MGVIKKTHLITCYLDKDKAEELAAFLHRECQLNTAYFAHARVCIAVGKKVTA